MAVAESSTASTLGPGDRVRWDRPPGWRSRRSSDSEGSSLFLEETPTETFERIGGLDRQIDELQRTIALHLHHPDSVKRYQLSRKGSVLLVGPPGTGKTMMARALANWLPRFRRPGARVS